MTLLADTSVVVPWFHAQGEPDLDACLALLDAHRSGRERLLLLDLGVYEVGNVLHKALKLSGPVVAEALEVLRRLVGPVVHPAPSWHARAVTLAGEHRLTFYDASWAAAAEALGCPLVTSDRALLAAGLGVAPGEIRLS